VTSLGVAAGLLAVDPVGLGGAVLRGGHTPAVRAWVAAVTARLAAPHRVRRVPPGITAERLGGGLDLAATLVAGRPVLEPGLPALAHEGALVVPMAERLSAEAVGLLTQVMDTRTVRTERDGVSAVRPAACALLLLDEAEPDEPSVAASLADRVAFDLRMPAGAADPVADAPSAATVAAARARLPQVTVPDEAVVALVAAAASLGVDSLRAAGFAVRAARAHAAVAGRDVADGEDLAAAAALVLGPRATRLPQPPEDAPAPPDPPPPSSGPEDAAEPPGAEEERELAERVVAAAAAAIPPDLLALLAAGAAGGRGGGRQGEAATEGPRGRRIGTRRGDPRRGARLDLLATIRAAVPWQRLRGGTPGDGQLAVRPDDFRIQRRWRPAATTTILVVDASGSTALHRLNEAKGAAEQLLAASYVRRDAVAMITFRGAGAELVLPPTRALARAKRALVGLPGGGGTPLAAALDRIGEVQRQVRRGGGRTVVLILSDGRANVTRAGTGGRPAAHAEALGAAQRLRAERVEGAWLDIGPRPSPVAREVAEAMGLRYLPLPIADAEAITRVATLARDAA
jgi:magnesium chelatase subunit D